MPLILPVKGTSPTIPDNCYIAENATVVGYVTMGQNCSVWFNAVVRGDVNEIIIGDRVNIQDGAIIHCTYERAATTIGNDVSIGHNAIVHGCKVQDNVLIGMGSIVMDDAVVESNSIVAAGAVVTEGTVVPSGTIYAGIPAKKVKDIPEELAKERMEKIASNYMLYASWFK